MNIILLGMPGSGKGTVATWLQEKKNYSHISTGDLLRNEVQAGTEVGKKVQKIMNEGSLVSDDLMIAIIKNFLTKKNDGKGVIFDGFPRTLKQAHSLEKIVTIDKVVFLKVDEETVVNRLLNRVSDSGEKREDDSESTIRSRIKIFYQNTQPLIDYYEEKKLLHIIDGALGVEEVRLSIDPIL